MCNDRADSDTGGQKPVNNEAIYQKIKELQKVYAGNIPKRVQTIRELWQQLTENWLGTTLESLEREVHSFTGSGATYGFPDISTSAREAETIFRNIMKENIAPDQEIKDKARTALDVLLGILEDTQQKFN